MNPITINGNKLEEVNVFTYLGAKVTDDGNCETEVYSRLFKAQHAFAGLRNIWKSHQHSLTTKTRVYKS